MTTEPICPECESRDISITPVPGLWIQYWCNSCEHFWWERSNVTKGEKVPPKN